MIVAVSTVKDSLERLRRWTNHNLANGVDHMIVFVDDADPNVMDGLAESEHVTPIDSRSWWGDGRPPRLNVRQRINANAVRAVAARVDGVDWVLHIDADEIALIDRAQLDALPGETAAVRLAPFEAASQYVWPSEHDILFKRLLSEAELQVLTGLGTLQKATNNEYFHGHVGGKVAMRPVSGLWLGTHHVVDANREKQPAFEAPWLRLLHYESHTAQEFVRKWSNLSTSGGPVSTRGARSTLATAVRGLLELDLDAQKRHDFMMRLFDLHVRDDVELLTSLGLLVKIVPSDGQHAPRAAAGTIAQLQSSLRSLNGIDKTCFEPGGDESAARQKLHHQAHKLGFLSRRP